MGKAKTLRVPNELIAEIQTAGALMANLCYNLAQRPNEPLSAHNPASMDELRKRWDAAMSKLHETKPAAVRHGRVAG